MNYFNDSGSLSAFKHLCNMCMVNVVMVLYFCPQGKKKLQGLEVFCVYVLGFFPLVFGVIQI